jgi:hypothetical protein
MIVLRLAIQGMGNDVDEYLCLTVLSRGGESEAAFKTRLSEFWSALLRSQPEDFEKVYAEAVEYERHGTALGRRYLVEAGVAVKLAKDLARGGFEHPPIDEDDLYSKYEAAPPEWFWIEH